MKFRVFDIKWDTDGEQLDLPAEMIIETADDEDDHEGFISDEISNRTGFCHGGFAYEKLEK